MGDKHVQLIRSAALVALVLSLSGCAGFLKNSPPSDQAQASGPRAASGVLHRRSDAQGAPLACVNDLAVFHAHLQMPGSSGMDLNKPVTAYVQEAGGAGAAIAVVNVELNNLNQRLDSELADRNPFDPRARTRSDDAISVLEDGILLNEALAEALECRR